MIATTPAVHRLAVVAAVAVLAATAPRSLRLHHCPRHGGGAPRSTAPVPAQVAELRAADQVHEPAPATIVVLDPGAGPRAPIRYHPRPGSRTRFALTLQDRGRPPRVITGTAELRRVDRDGAFLLATVVDGAKPDHLDLAGLAVDTLFEATGAIRSIEIRAPRSAARSLIERVAFAVSALEQLPDEPVAVGARWQATALLPGGDGAPVARTQTTTLVAVAGPGVELRSTTLDSAGGTASTERGTALRPVALRARGEVHRSVALDTLIGTDASWRMGERTLADGSASHREPLDDRVDLTRSRAAEPGACTEGSD